ncbi:aldo/keto reductase [Microbacterium testaceum]|uniref:aldo/keto reductase n=1 Tax=Microbacterium testaceum TaxID=2033 RepID=UPI003419D377
MATVMREPSRGRREALLRTAVEEGIRKFDTAPIYGLGEADRDLASLIRATDDVLHVTTKFGRTLSTRARAIAPFQRPLRALLKNSSRVRRAARSGAGGVETPPAPTVSEVRSHAERYCELFGIERLDELLTHDIPWDKNWVELMSELAEDSSTIPVERLGASGSGTLLASYPKAILSRMAVVQTPLADDHVATGPQRHVLFGVLSELARRTRSGASPSARYLSDLADAQPGHNSAFPLLLAVGLRAFPSAEIVVGTSSSDHLRGLLSGATKWLEQGDLDWNLMIEVTSNSENCE